MTKCGKGCMPECEYFTTGGCISPFNCQYKIETGYINSATSIPTYMEKQMSMTAEEIEHCLERFTMGKTTDVMNFDYAGTLAYIQRLKAENAELKSSLTHANEECLKWHERAQNLLKDSGGSISGYEKKISDLQAENAALRERLGKAVELPCRVGDTIYSLERIDLKIRENKVIAITFLLSNSVNHLEVQAHNFRGAVASFESIDFGRYVFINRADAEARLAELKGEKK